MIFRNRGFSLTELMIVVAIMGILAGIAFPSFRDLIDNARMRTASDGIQAGLQLARMEALRRNGRVTFWLVNDLTTNCARNTAGPSWVVSIDDPVSNCDISPSDTTAPRIIQTKDGREGSRDINLTTTPGTSNCITFNGFGRVEATCTGGATASLTGIRLTQAVASPSTLVLELRVTSGGAIKVCNPSVTNAADPRFC